VNSNLWFALLQDPVFLLAVAFFIFVMVYYYFKEKREKEKVLEERIRRLEELQKEKEHINT